MQALHNLKNDFYECFKNSHVWFLLSFYEIKVRYRRTVIGPLWLTLGTAITILGMGLVWSSIFSMNIKDFLPYFASGMILWLFMASILIESCSAFTSQVAIIHNVKMSYFTHIMTMISRNFIIMLHNMLVIVAVFIICGKTINFEILWFVPGIILLVLNSFWACIVLGIFATRYRDVTSIVTSITTLIMFVTPIMWKPEMLQGDRRFIATLNPFTHMLNIIRNPLLGEAPPLESYYIILGIFIVGSSFSLWLYNRYSSRLVFWM